MFSFLHRPKPAMIREACLPESKPRLLSFDAARIVCAITFHLLDDGKVPDVDRESSELAITLLAQRMDQLTISADKWAAMGNLQRFQWLVHQSHITIKPGRSGSMFLLVR